MTAPRVLPISLLLVAPTGAPIAKSDGKSPFLALDDQAMLAFIQNEPHDYMMEYTVYDPDKLCVVEVAGREAALVPKDPKQRSDRGWPESRIVTQRCQPSDR